MSVEITLINQKLQYSQLKQDKIMKHTSSALSVILASSAYISGISADQDQYKTTNLRGLQTSPIRQLNQNEFLVNIIFERGSTALALAEDTDCGSLYSVTPILFERIRNYVPGQGFQPFVTSSRFEWKINVDNPRLKVFTAPARFWTYLGRTVIEAK